MTALLWRWVDRHSQGKDLLTFLLLLAVLATMITAVLDAGWIAKDWVIIPAALGGFTLSALLAWRPLASWKAWLLITLYGLLISLLSVARLWPPIPLLSRWADLRAYWLQNGAEFWDRALIWFNAVRVGGSSNETIIFALIMSLVAWFLAALIAWSAYRSGRPLWGLSITALIIALNGYYGAAAIEYAALFVALAALTTAVMNYDSLERDWQTRSVDYSREIKLEIFIFAFLAAVGLLAISFALPTLRPGRIAQAILGQPAVAQVEDTLERAFGGVDARRGRSLSPGSPGGRGLMPRSFLLGNAPELQEIVVMTAEAQVAGAAQDGRAALARHWRALSYEVYTGRGWSLSEENEQNLPASEPVPLRPAQATIALQQDVHWRFDNRVIRYSLGLPLTFDHPTLISLRGEQDFVRARAEDNNRYQVLSRISIATPEQLRQAGLQEVPEPLLSRYTQLPDDFPDDVRQLAQEVSGSESTPFDQARRLEQFLRQYEYSLDVPLPPADSDPVHFFLFDLQKGYCDYYASSMVVMARSLGLPARMASGFLAQRPDQDGVQTIYQINAHSWTEIYFAGYGWVEFEPTAAFISPHDSQLSAPDRETFQAQVPDYETEVAPIPQPLPTPGRPWPAIVIGLGIVLLLAAAAVLLWRGSRLRLQEDHQWAYYNFQRSAAHLGQPPSPSQTPNEFSAHFLAHIQNIAQGPRSQRWASGLNDPLLKLTEIFNRRQYSAGKDDDNQTAVSLWRRMRRPLWLLRLTRRFKL